MAASATPRPAEVQPGRLIAVAYSGGRDSTALLHATARAAAALNAQADACLQVLALHIHHGLSRQADAWLQHCEAQCAGWVAAGLPVQLRVHRVTAQPQTGQSIEAWARGERYTALDQLCRASGVHLLLLAHHQRDQAETLLLQALRGAGVAGMAAMPLQQWRDGLCWARPWLGQSRQQIEAYVQAHSLSFVDDDSNGDPRYARNRLRLQVWPGLTQAFPQAEASLAAASTWAQEALALHDEVAQADLAGLVSQDGLNLPALLEFSPARASNALRAWLSAVSGQPARASLVRRLLQEAAGQEAGQWPCADGVLRLYRGCLAWESALERADSLGSASPRHEVDLSQPGDYPEAAWGGVWRVQPVSQGGVAPHRLARLLMCARVGGEQFQKAPGCPPRSLKKSYQEAGIPAWRRQGPLLLTEGTPVLVFAPGLGLDARHWAAPGEAQLSVCWEPFASGEADIRPD